MRLQPTAAWIAPGIGYYARLARGDGLDLLALLWPLLWASTLAGQLQPDLPLFGALLAALLLFRSALSIAMGLARSKGAKSALRDAGPWVVTALLVSGLCLLPFLGWPALLLPVTLLFLLLYRLLRDQSYTAEVWLALGLAWPSLAAYAVQGNGVGESGWLLLLGAACWILSQLILRQWPVTHGKERRSLAQLFGRRAPLVVCGLAVAALVIFWLVGRHLALGIFFHIGLATALAISAWQQLLVARRGVRGIRPALLAGFWWGAAVQAGILFHLICISH